MAQSIEGGVVIVNTLSVKKQWKLPAVHGGKRAACRRKICRTEDWRAGSRSRK